MRARWGGWGGVGGNEGNEGNEAAEIPGQPDVIRMALRVVRCGTSLIVGAAAHQMARREPIAVVQLRLHLTWQTKLM